MSKGLEAYKELKNVMLSSATKFTFQSLINCNDKNKELDNTIEKELKALEIIRNIGILRPYETISGKCWLETMCDAIKLTKENYDLLKEILNDN